MLEPVGRVPRRMRRRGAAGQSGIGQMWGAKEIEVSTLAKKSLPIKGTGQAVTTKNEWVRGVPLKMQLSGGSDEVGKAVPYPNNRETRRRGGSLKLPQHQVSGLDVQKEGNGLP